MSSLDARLGELEAASQPFSAKLIGLGELAIAENPDLAQVLRVMATSLEPAPDKVLALRSVGRILGDEQALQEAAELEQELAVPILSDEHWSALRTLTPKGSTYNREASGEPLEGVGSTPLGPVLHFRFDSHTPAYVNQGRKRRPERRLEECGFAVYPSSESPVAPVIVQYDYERFRFDRDRYVEHAPFEVVASIKPDARPIDFFLTDRGAAKLIASVQVSLRNPSNDIR